MLNILRSADESPQIARNNPVNPLIIDNHIFQKLIQNSKEGFTLLDERFQVIYRNAAAEQITGWKTTAAGDDKIDDQIHPVDKEQIETLLAEILSEPGKSKSAIFRSKHFDGHFIWLDCTFSNFLHDPDFHSFVFNFKDISNEKNHEEQLQLGERKFRAMVENGADGIVVLDRAIRPVYRSPGFTNILGYTEDEVLALNPFEIVHPDDLAYIKLKLEECKNNPATPVRNVIYRVKHKQGQYVTLNATLTNCINEPAIDGIVNNFRDVTEKKKDEARLIESENKYRSIFERSPLPSLIWDFETFKIKDCNAAAINKYGYSHEEFLNLTIEALWPEDEQEITVPDIVKSIKKQNYFHAERRHRKKNGDIIYVDISGQRIHYNGEDMALGMITDITESHYYGELDKLERDILESSTKKSCTLKEILAGYLKGMEALHPGMFCSLFEQRCNKLYNMSAPSLPPRYLNEIEGIEISEKKGPCGKAAQTKQTVISTNIQHDDFSDRYKKVAELNGFKSCWSHPVLDADGNVLAVFACYYNFQKHPTSLELKTVERAVKILQIILENKKWEQALVNSNNRFERATEATFDVIWDWDLATDSVYYSGNFKKIFGHEAGVISDNLPFDIANIHPDDIKQVPLYPDEIRNGAMTNWAAEYRFKKTNGDYAYVRDRAIVIRDEQGVGIRMIGAMQDISGKRREEQHLKLLESVVTNASDSVLISDAIVPDGATPRILYVNDAFTKMTGYTAEEVLGKTPEMLFGPRTDEKELKRCVEAMNNWQPVEGTIINYKKNGQMYWKSFSITPVANFAGTYTHWIAIEHDVTTKKNEELQKSLQAEISRIFNGNDDLKTTLQRTLTHIADFGGFDIGEVWLSEPGNNKVNLIAKCVTADPLNVFYEESNEITSFDKNTRFPIDTSLLPPVVYWHYRDGKKLLRHEAALKAGLKTAYIVPLKYNNELTGLLMLGSQKDEEENAFYSKLFENFSPELAAAINRKQLEQELHQVFNFTPDILCVANTDGYFKKVNPAMSELLGYDKTELLSRPFMEFIFPADREPGTAELNNIINGKPAYYTENRYITKTGKLKWLAWTTTGASEQGDIYCSAKDITEKKELEELLSKATRLARIGAWDVDLENGLVNWSEMTREIHEAEADFVPNINAAGIFYSDGEDRALIIKTMEDAVNQGTPADLEFEITTAKGNKKWVRVIVETEFTDGKCSKLYGSFQDIDNRKKAELAEKNALEERNAILESIDDAFYAVDTNWNVTYWNNRAETLFGMPKNKIINRKLLDVFPDREASESHNRLIGASETGQVTHFEHYSPFINTWLETSVYPAKNGLTVFIKDITDRKKSEIRLNELNEDLQKQAMELAISNDELEQFAYVASHDLQEPLRMVTSFMTQLEQKYSNVVDERGRKYIYYAVDGAKRMRQIILDLLDFSRVGKSGDIQENVDFNVLLDEVTALYGRQIEELKASVTFKNLPTIATCKTPFMQVFQNLVGNSLKYHKAGQAPVIHISCKETKLYYEFAVRDNGIGISPEFFNKIFIIFQRLHNKDEYSGTGMGLAITKKIIEKLGGKIWVKSVVGQGSTFYFTILKNHQ